jgi:hypothetical protein
VDGSFSWPSGSSPASASESQLSSAGLDLQDFLGQGARVVSLLDKFGMGMNLQAAMAPHPRWAVERRGLA